MAKLKNKRMVYNLMARAIAVIGDFLKIFYLSLLDANKKLRKLNRFSGKATLEKQTSYVTGYEANSASIDEFERVSLESSKEKN